MCGRAQMCREFLGRQESSISFPNFFHHNVGHQALWMADLALHRLVTPEANQATSSRHWLPTTIDRDSSGIQTDVPATTVAQHLSTTSIKEKPTRPDAAHDGHRHTCKSTII
ncbi:hypothetical protein M758_1G215700 [Ceratodon purpureus]|nr:hypothetical protein M758_1G215700 [Ceratodon purpureus]